MATIAVTLSRVKYKAKTRGIRANWRHRVQTRKDEGMKRTANNEAVMCFLGAWGNGGVIPRICLKLQESLSKASRAAEEVATAFFVTCFLVTTDSHMVKTHPPYGKCLGTSLI